MQNNISVIISGQAHPEVLKKVLWGYNTQTYRNFELIVTGSNTAEILNEVKRELFYPVTIIKGADANDLMADALAASTTGYIVTASAKAVPRQDFVEQHIKYREEGYYLCGGLIKGRTGNDITKESIYTGKAFKGRDGITKGLTGSVLNHLVPVDREWNTGNASAWLADFAPAFRMAAGEGRWDKNIARYLQKDGIKPRQMAFSSVCIEVAE